MINYNRKYKEANDPALSDEENDAIIRMEEFTDNCIEVQFHTSRAIHVDAQAIEKIASPFGIYRSQIIMNEWKNRYKANGWEVNFVSDHTSTWLLTGKQ
jgi:hypothetical protein